jgi:hypothetical protein
MSTTGPQQVNAQPTEQVRLPGTPPPEAPKHRLALIGVICAVALAGLAVAAVLLIGSHTATVKGPSPSQAYQAKLSAVLTPVVASNVTLSSALQGIDGSKPTFRTASNAVKAAQQQTVAARGAMAVLVVPAADQQIDQQATQELTQEAGYLSALSTTLGDPTSSSSASVQPLASAVSSAFVPLASVAPGGSVSISGVDNLQAWVSGANAAAKRHTPPPVLNNNTTVVNPPVVVTPTPSSSSGTDSEGYTYGPGCSNNPTNPLPGCTNSPSVPAGDPEGSCSNGITVDRQTTSCGLAESVYANYTADGPVSGYSTERGQSYTFDCSTGGPGTTGYTICQGQAGDAPLYLRWHR